MILLRLYLKGKKNPHYRKRIGERFGLNLPNIPSGKALYFIHAVSVGEFLAIRPLLIYWLKQEPEALFYLTCTTPTGSEQIQKFQAEYANQIYHSYLPYDVSFLMKRFLKHLKPQKIILMETEIWVNLILQAEQLNIPVILENARLSKKSGRRYGKFLRKIMGFILPKIWINTQNKNDKKRFLFLGADKNKMTVLPSLKYHASVPKIISEEALFIQKSDFVFLSASTHEGEEEIILKTFRELLKIKPQAQLLLAPRHPDRTNKISELIKSFGFNVNYRSKNEKVQQVYLIDTLGELSAFFAHADVAFIGGSLIERGGHNPLEALHANIPVCFGQFMFNFQTIRDELIHYPFVREVENHPELFAKTLIELHEKSDKNAIKKMMAQYQNILEQHYQFISKI